MVGQPCRGVSHSFLAVFSPFRQRRRSPSACFLRRGVFPALHTTARPASSRENWALLGIEGFWFSWLDLRRRMKRASTSLAKTPRNHRLATRRNNTSTRQMRPHPQSCPFSVRSPPNSRSKRTTNEESFASTSGLIGHHVTRKYSHRAQTTSAGATGETSIAFAGVHRAPTTALVPLVKPQIRLRSSLGELAPRQPASFQPSTSAAPLSSTLRLAHLALCSPPRIGHRRNRYELFSFSRCEGQTIAFCLA